MVMNEMNNNQRERPEVRVWHELQKKKLATPTQIRNSLKISYYLARNVLEGLEKMGVVTLFRAGKLKVYKINEVSHDRTNS